MTSRAVQDVFLIGFVLAQFVAVSGLSAKNPGKALGMDSFPPRGLLDLRPTFHREHPILMCAAAPTLQVGGLQVLGARIETRFPGVRETLINAWAALLAGLAAYTVATPIEAIKVGLQTWPGSNLPSVIGKIVKVKGLGGFFYGLDAMYAAGLPYSLVMYSVYQPIKKMTNTFLGDNNSALGAIVGASFAELIGLLVFMPGELVRTRMMSNPGAYRGFADAARQIVALTGPGTLFRGLKVTCLRDVPYTAITFVLFESVRDVLAAKQPTGDANFLDSIVAGVAAALVASSFTIPMDVLKSNIMASSGSSSMRSMAANLFRTAGLPIFGRGYFPYMSINMFKWTASMAVYATAREHYGLKSGASSH